MPSGCTCDILSFSNEGDELPFRKAEGPKKNHLFIEITAI